MGMSLAFVWPRKVLPRHYSLQLCGLSCPYIAPAPPTLHAVKEIEPGDNLKKLPGSQSPARFKQPQTTLIIFHPTQTLMFYGDIGRKAIILQDFQQENMEQGLISNSSLPTLPKDMKSPQQAQKKVFLFKVANEVCSKKHSQWRITKRKKKEKKEMKNILNVNGSSQIKYILYSPLEK